MIPTPNLDILLMAQDNLPVSSSLRQTEEAFAVLLLFLALGIVCIIAFVKAVIKTKHFLRPCFRSAKKEEDTMERRSGGYRYDQSTDFDVQKAVDSWSKAKASMQKKAVHSDEGNLARMRLWRIQRETLRRPLVEREICRGKGP